MGERSEAELVLALRRGEAAAFDEAYALHRDRIYGFLHRLTGQRALTDDLFQETWMRLARAAGSLGPDTRLAAWLFTVARNLHRSHRRWALLDARRADALAHEPAPPASPPDEQAEARRRLDALERALAALPLAHREVLLLVGVEGLDQEQAAAVLGIGYAALRQRLARARALLASRLGAAALSRAEGTG